MCDGSKGCRMVKACTSPGLLKELPLRMHRQGLFLGRKPGYLSRYICQVGLLQAGRGTGGEGGHLATAGN